jgi:hypothetical protein
MRTVLPLALGLAACTADTLDIELEIAAPDCQAADFAQVSVIAIAVYGEHDGTHCALARRCVYAVDELARWRILAISAALREATQPLVEWPARAPSDQRDAARGPLGSRDASDAARAPDAAPTTSPRPRTVPCRSSWAVDVREGTAAELAS